LRLIGAHIDITARRRAEEQRELVSRELSHRIANIFTVVNSLVRMAARFEPTNKEFAEKLESRLQSLHRAHAFVSRKEIGDGGLKLLLARLFEQYQGASGRRVSIQGEDALVGSNAATALALVFHELATNAVKYGALSIDEGSVYVVVAAAAGQLRLLWREEGGPAIVNAPSGPNGFGSVLVERAARSQLGASMTYDWRPEGLSVTVEVSLVDLAR
jgi:two-component sensor histidine kinase